jgi:hypothetical protein
MRANPKMNSAAPDNQDPADEPDAMFTPATTLTTAALHDHEKVQLWHFYPWTPLPH